MNRIWILIGFASLAGACEVDDYKAPEDQPLLFEYRYVNYAWGYQEHGWLIDQDGYIRYFNLPADYRVPDSNGFLSFEDLEYNLGQTDSIIDQVDDTVLARYVGYIPGAAAGEIGKSRNIAADAGSSILTCYFYDTDASAYRQVFLAASGDFEQFNLSEEAEKLVDWLKEFDIFWLSE